MHCTYTSNSKYNFFLEKENKKTGIQGVKSQAIEVGFDLSMNYSNLTLLSNSLQHHQSVLSLPGPNSSKSIQCRNFQEIRIRQTHANGVLLALEINIIEAA